MPKLNNFSSFDRRQRRRQGEEGGGVSPPLPDDDDDDDDRAQKIWEAVLQRLEGAIASGNYVWLKETKGVSLKGDRLVVAASDEFTRSWLEQRFMTVITKHVSDVLGTHAEVQIVASTEKGEIDGAADSLVTRLQAIGYVGAAALLNTVPRDIVERCLTAVETRMGLPAKPLKNPSGLLWWSIQQELRRLSESPRQLRDIL